MSNSILSQHPDDKTDCLIEIDLNNVNIKTLTNVMISLLKSAIINNNSFPLTLQNDQFNQITINHILHRTCVLIQLIKQRQSIDSQLQNLEELKSTFKTHNKTKYKISSQLKCQLINEIKQQFNNLKSNIKTSKKSTQINQNLSNTLSIDNLNGHRFTFNCLDYGRYLSQYINLTPNSICKYTSQINSKLSDSSIDLDPMDKLPYEKLLKGIHSKSSEFDQNLISETNSFFKAASIKRQRNSTGRKRRRKSIDDDY